jgi:hypothetical protein
MTMCRLRWMTAFRPGFGWRAGAAAGVIVLGTACDGYPTKDVPVVSPSEMSQAERVEAMNKLGQEAQQRGRWSFRLEPGCVLEVSMRRRGEAEQSFAIQLQGAAVETRFDKGGDTYAILVRQQAASDTESLPVLETPRWTDSVEMTSLVRALQGDCRQVGAANPWAL